MSDQPDYRDDRDRTPSRDDPNAGSEAETGVGVPDVEAAEATYGEVEQSAAPSVQEAGKPAPGARDAE